MRTQKRVYAVRRAPDGSAFEKCENCGKSVPIALNDMHECDESRKCVKRFRGICERRNVAKQSVSDQPKSPFCFFMESFKKTCDLIALRDIDRKGFEIWKSMPNEERQPYISQAEKVNSAWLKALLEEENYKPQVDYEADSAETVKSDQISVSYEDYDYFDRYGSCLYMTD